MAKIINIEDEESIRNHDENSFYAIEKYCEKHGLIFHEDEMKDIVVGARETIGYFKELFGLIKKSILLSLNFLKKKKK